MIKKKHELLYMFFLPKEVCMNAPIKPACWESYTLIQKRHYWSDLEAKLQWHNSQDWEFAFIYLQDVFKMYYITQ